MGDGPFAIVVGESLVDVVTRPDGSIEELPGGSAANAAVALGRLERPVRFVTAFAADHRGDLVARHLEKDGVVLASDPYLLSRTSVATARIGRDGVATYEFDLDWRIGQVTAPEPHVLHVCSLGPVVPPGAEDVIALVDRLGARTTVSYDINARPAITGTGPELVERVLRMVERADLVKASDEDLAALWPDKTAAEAAKYLLTLGPVAVVVTRGGAGACWYAGSRGEPMTGEIAAEPTTVVDTIGAGDAFGAGLLDALWARLGAEGRERLAELEPPEWSAASLHAARCAAITVGRPGADPPRRSELRTSRDRV